jgi:CHAT domain/FHA domain
MPSLNLAIARLVNAGTNNFAIWVVKAPYPSGHVIHDCVWSPHLTQVWLEWQQLFAQHSTLDVSSQQPEADTEQITSKQIPLDLVAPPSGQPTSYTGRLMQYFGNSLWEWVFAGAILNSLEHSRGIATGQKTNLRLRLELRDPYLVGMPWEIMQRPGQSAISLSHNVLFSRTTSDVEPLPLIRTDPALNILLVLGEDENLQLDLEAKRLEQTLTRNNPSASYSQGYAPCIVHTLIKPTPEELIAKLETRLYNVCFYAGHGLRGPDGGLLFLHEQATLNGIELAQVLTRTGVKLAVFNSCWGAQPASVNHQSIPYSSLAEVMIRHGVPAVLGMRDQIADQESLTFIEAFLQALRERKAIDEAVVVARQQLLTQYKFNYPAWTLPVLYLHPEFDGQLLRSLDESVTEMPETSLPGLKNAMPPATLRKLEKEGGNWLLQTRITRIGRTTENDIVIQDLSVSRLHAQIICRDSFTEVEETQSYFLRDDSTYGTLISKGSAWMRIHHQEVPLESGTQLKFGSTRSDTWEFTIGNL